MTRALAAPVGALTRQHADAITVDDLPRGGDGSPPSVVDFFDRRSVDVAGEEFPQVLLIHDNQLTADVMAERLDMVRRRGYRFESLDDALADAAYGPPDTYVGRVGFSWIHRWSKTKGMPAKGEPDPAPWVISAFEAR
jgi:hypothetical protein